jgi:putative addiction module killer protein
VSFQVKYYEESSGRCLYREWLDRLDRKVAFRIARHVNRLAEGLGDVKYLNDKVFELRIDFGPGYRVYFMHRGNETIIVLGGSEKRDQDRAIERAKRIAATLT